MVIWKFRGTAGLGPMWWTVMPSEAGGYDVAESYDEGETWVCNCVLESEQAAWDFIADWFASMYGH